MKGGYRHYSFFLKLKKKVIFFKRKLNSWIVFLDYARINLMHILGVPFLQYVFWYFVVLKTH